jgi:nucleoside-diphosphate-sugar epimerase
VRALVTGGGGFLGQAIVRILRARGDEVVSYSRGACPELARQGVTCVRGDLADVHAIARAAEGADVVFHTAAKAGVWGPRAEYEKVNVEGTRNVITACVEARVARLVHTSSPSVCFDGRDHVGASNDLPYARRFLAAYPATKATAEKLVLGANDARLLATCALRPHLLFGPGDPHLVPRLFERARTGKLAIVGSGRNRVTLCHVDNAAHAHVDAADRLSPDAPHAGRAYFVVQEEPVVLWEWIAALLTRAGLPPITRRVPLAVAYAAGAACEAVWKTFARAGEPPMTRFVALQLAKSHVYDLAPARRDFAYEERIPMDVATESIAMPTGMASRPHEAASI